MDASRRKQALLAVLCVVLSAAVYMRWPRAADPTRPTSAARPGAAKAPAGTAPATAPDVHLEALEATRPAPGSAERNLFTFATRFVAAPSRAAAAPPGAPIPSGPPPPPPVPPIGLKFIGVLEAAGAARIAILSDGMGPPIYGKEGDAVLGRYRILRIGSESIEMDYLDGHGRQIIRLSGS